jgi:uncharacterized protein
MKTVDIHTHLLSPSARFDRLFDRISVRFFAKGLGVDPKRLRADPYNAYVEAMAGSIRNSHHVEKACLFGVDSRFDEKGREIDRDRTVCAMNEDVLTIAARYPDQFIPFFSVNPRRTDALELIERYLEQGCKGAKFLQNYWGLDCNDEHLRPYYEKLAQRGIPLIIHIGSEYTIDSDARYERPDMLALPLACGVNVIAAHMGLGRVNHKLRPWRNFSKLPQHFDDDYFQLLEILQTHDNLYADISAILAPMRARALRHLSQQTSVHDKLLFGTDYPVPFTVRWNSYDLESTTRKQLGEESNPFDRYTQAVLAYFPQESPIYTNYRKVLIDH